MTVDGGHTTRSPPFVGKVGRTVDVRLRRHAGAEPMTVKVNVELLKPLPMFEKAIADSATSLSAMADKIGSSASGRSTARNSMGAVAEALAEGHLKDAEGLVLDLRGRWGGGDLDAAELFVGDTPPFRLIPRKGEDVLANVRWHRPVVAIIDGGSRSGLEVFAYALKVNGIPLVVAYGCGALLAGRAFLLPDDSLLELAVLDAVIADDVRLEGNGVEPDVPVAFAVPYAAGKDRSATPPSKR